MAVLSKLRALRQTVLGMNYRNLGLIYPNNPRTHYRLADDKYLAKEIMESEGIACPRTCAVIERIGDIEEAWNTLKEWEQLVIKPARGSGGKGILLLRKQGGQWYSGGTPISEYQIFSHLANTLFGIFSFGDSDVALVEELVEPHPFFQELYPAGVPDFRIILLKGVPLMGMLRMPTAKSGGKANLHQGGLGIGVDMEAGTLQWAYDGQKHLAEHPDSKSTILGKEIPYWEELVALSVQTAQHFPLDYLGVDLVIDAHKGPMVMEVNVRPGLGIQLANRQGLKEILQQKDLL
ncbi:MAG: sugar-transfer associated ATP-grasp domain-containing protein [Bacteroidota bacterium]